MMKYQQLENLESGWKWQYLMRKWKENEVITRYIDSSQIKEIIEQLQACEHNPEKIENWIEKHMAPDLNIKLNQAIRAKRKRYFNAEHRHTKKKSIDLEFSVWKKLSERAKQLDSTLSDTIEYLLSESLNSQDDEAVHDLDH